MKIINYEPKYQNQIKDFLIDICVNEFHKISWLDYLQNKDFSPYLKDSNFIIVLDDNQIIATCGMLKINEDIIKLNSFYVKKNYRHKGIGNKIFDISESFAKNNGFKKIILCAHKSFSDSIEFYNNHNYKLYKVETDNMEEPELWYIKNISKEFI